MPSITRLFTAHPDSVQESYGQHFRFAMRFAFSLALAACAALIHAVLPFLFEKTASGIIERLYNRTQNRATHSG